MRIGIDIHGVIDHYDWFTVFCNEAIDGAHEIHILTGSPADEAEVTLREHRIVYTSLFSIIDYNREIGTDMWDNDPRGKGWWMDREDWVKSKGVYAHSVHLDLHFDNELRYAEHFPDYCTFVHVPPKGFEKILPLFRID